MTVQAQRHFAIDLPLPAKIPQDLRHDSAMVNAGLRSSESLFKNHAVTAGLGRGFFIGLVPAPL
jgi:hypothetical protein